MTKWYFRILQAEYSTHKNTKFVGVGDGQVLVRSRLHRYWRKRDLPNFLWIKRKPSYNVYHIYTYINNFWRKYILKLHIYALMYVYICIKIGTNCYMTLINYLAQNKILFRLSITDVHIYTRINNLQQCTCQEKVLLFYTCFTLCFFYLIFCYIRYPYRGALKKKNKVED